MAERAKARARVADPALEALLTLTDPWLFGREEEVRARLVGIGSLDWSAVVARADRHRVTPLLADRIKTAEVERQASVALPESCAQALRQRAREALASELAALAELRRLKSLFYEKGITFLVLKGLALSELCFGKLGVRVNRDIDILIAPAEIDTAHAALAALGYRRVEPAEGVSLAAIERTRRRVKDWVYVHETLGSIVELHYRLFDNPWLCDVNVMDRHRTITLFGQLDLATLSAEDELPYLALHGALHAWSRLKWLLDFAILLRDRSPAQIAEAVRRAKGGPAACAMHQAISLCWRLFSPESPEPHEKRPWRTPLLSAAAMHTLASHHDCEIEDTRFGTTLKNASHYLLWGRPAYLAAEFAFDITYLPAGATPPRFGLPIWLWRPISWMSRRLRTG